MNKAKEGFTLAEILVTLAIIGVIASLTIPGLMQNINAQKYQTALKKEIALLNQAILSAASNNSTDPSSAADANGLATFFANNLKVLKNSGTGTLWLVDGSKIEFHRNATCATINNPNAITNPFTGIGCAAVIDINGDKGPNTSATPSTPADVYVVGITTTSVVALGGVTTALSSGSDNANFIKDSGGNTPSPAYVLTSTTVGNASFNAITGGST